MTESKNLRLWIKFMVRKDGSYGGTKTIPCKYTTERHKAAQIRCYYRFLDKVKENLWMARIYDHDNTILYSQKFNQDVDR